MRIWSIVTILSVAAVLFACGDRLPATPLETFKTYTKAIKKKDADAMKLLLSDATIKMHEREATAENVTLNEILERDTLFNPAQKSVEFRDEKIDGETATLQVKNSFGSWETLPFILEDGVWKIDKLGQANQLMKEHIEKQNQAFGIEKESPAFVEEVPVVTPEPELLLPQE